ncbi:MAG: hypothetical protein HYV16_14375 [Gammaproteobacteria bacterium]|nr:hypothetical protein [Gammaproteobacteria bacterium]
MKRALVLVAIALGLGLLLGPWLKTSTGTLILVLGDAAAEHTTVRMRLWVALAALAGAVLLGFLLWRGLILGLNLMSGGMLSPRVRHRRARRQTVAGMIALAEGYWDKAEKQLLAGLKHSDVPLLNQLMAAQAAQMQKADARRDEYLRDAALAEPEAQVAVGLTQAQLQLSQGQKEQALATLAHVRELAPKHPYVLKLLYRLHLQFEDWPALQALLPALDKQGLVPEDELAGLRLRVHGSTLRREAGLGAAALHSAWLALSKAEQQLPDLLVCYCELLARAGQAAEAERLLRAALKKRFQLPLALAFCALDCAEPGAQLDTAESWLKAARQGEKSLDLLMALARLAMRAALWGKARAYLEEVLRLRPSAEAWWRLAQVQEKTGEQVAAQQSYRQGLALSVGARA